MMAPRPWREQQQRIESFSRAFEELARAIEAGRRARAKDLEPCTE
jgi:hypothetical protein